MKFQHNISEEELEKIEDYLSGALTSADKAAFETALQTDNSLQQKLDEVKLLRIGIAESFLVEKLNAFHPQKEQAPVRTMNTTMRRLLVAASILLVVLTTAYLLLFNKSNDEKLYAKYYSADPGLPGNMGGATNYTFDKAMLDYKNGEYAKAIEAWKNLPSNDTTVYFMGMAYMATGNNTAAIEQLTQSTAKPTNEFYKEACWYLGLAYLKAGDRTKAIVFIQQSDNPGKTDLLKALNDKQ